MRRIPKTLQILGHTADPGLPEAQIFMSEDPTCRGCGQARSLYELHMYYLAARNVQDPAEKAARALELCHSLIIELSNHVYCLHGQGGVLAEPARSVLTAPGLRVVSAERVDDADDRDQEYDD